MYLSHEKLIFIIPDHKIKLMFACLKISRLKIHPHTIYIMRMFHSMLNI